MIPCGVDISTKKEEENIEQHYIREVDELNIIERYFSIYKARCAQKRL